jgi:hypothetical protein
MVIEAFDKLNLFATVLAENILVFFSDLNDRFKAICGKGGGKNEQFFHSFFGAFLHNHIGKGFQPFLRFVIT